MGRTTALVVVIAGLVGTFGSTGCSAYRVDADQCYWAGTHTNIHGDAQTRRYQSQWRGGQASIDLWRGFARNRPDGRFAFFVPLDGEASSVLLVCEKQPGRQKATALKTGDAVQAFLLRWREMPDWWHQGSFVDSASRDSDPMNRLLDAPVSELLQMPGVYVMRGAVECRFSLDTDFDVSIQCDTEGSVPLDRQFISPRRDPAVPQERTAQQREREAKLSALERNYVPTAAEVDIRFERRRGAVNFASFSMSDHASRMDKAFVEERIRSE